MSNKITKEDRGSRGFPRGQCQIVYIRPWSDYEESGMADPTMVYSRDVEKTIKSYQENSYRPPDTITRGAMGNDNLVVLRWYCNPEDVPVPVSVSNDAVKILLGDAPR